MYPYYLPDPLDQQLDFLMAQTEMAIALQNHRLMLQDIRQGTTFRTRAIARLDQQVMDAEMRGFQRGMMGKTTEN